GGSRRRCSGQGLAGNETRTRVRIPEDEIQVRGIARRTAEIGGLLGRRNESGKDYGDGNGNERTGRLPGRLRLKHRRIDVFLLLGVLALVGMGIVIIYSSSAAFAQSRGLPDSFYLVNHIKKVIIGFVAFLIGMSVPYKTWEKAARPLMYLVIGLLVFVAFMGMSAHGARRWISFASFGLQPS